MFGSEAGSLKRKQPKGTDKRTGWQSDHAHMCSGGLASSCGIDVGIMEYKQQLQIVSNTLFINHTNAQLSNIWICRTMQKKGKGIIASKGSGRYSVAADRKVSYIAD